MAVTEVTNKSWFERILESIKGVIVGLLMGLVSFPVLFWNEGRAVKTAKSLDEGAGTVVSVKAESIDSSHDKRLVHVTGTSKTDDVLKDPDFAVQVNAIKLKREVEMYQWVEKKKSREEKKLGGGTRTVTTYDYEKAWKDGVIDSSDFKEEGHENPDSMPFEANSQVASKVTLGAFTLSEEQVSQLSDAQPLAAEPAAIEGQKASIKSGVVYLGGEKATPTIGDVCISWRVVRPGPLSVVAMQLGDSFAPFQTAAGDALSLVKPSTLTAAQMFQAAQDENATLTWILRGVGWFLLFMGLLLVFKPLSVFADVIPFVGSMLGAGLGVFSFLVSAALALITIAVSWIVVRPVLGVALLVLGGGAIAAIIMLGQRWKKSRPAPAAA